MDASLLLSVASLIMHPKEKMTLSCQIHLRLLDFGGTKGWNDAAFSTVFCQGLNPDIVLEMMFRDDKSSLDWLINLVICLDNILRDRRPSNKHSPMPFTSPCEPMEIGNTSLTSTEWLRQRSLCFYCSGADHQIYRCSAQGNPMPHQSSSWTCSSIHPSAESPFIFFPSPYVLQAELNYSALMSVVSDMIDSGSAGKFLNRNTAHRIQLPLIDLHSPVKINTIDGVPIGTGIITQCMLSMNLCISSLHSVKVSLLITDTPQHPLILGTSWLSLHNLCISLEEQEIIEWSDYCQQHCIQHPKLIIATTTIKSLDQDYTYRLNITT